MKTLMLTGAAALMGMTAIPAHAHTEAAPVEAMVVAQAEVNDSDRLDVTDITTVRFYSPDRARYATWDSGTSMWTVYSASDGAVVATQAQAEFDPIASGWARMSADADYVTDLEDGDRDDITDLTAERFYSADRATYAVFDEGESIWTVFDAASDAVVETFSDNDFDPDARGYARVDMDDSDRGDITDVTVAGTRFYAPESRNYVVWDETESRWYVYDGDSEARIGVVSEPGFDPRALGWQMAAGEIEDSDRADITDLAGRAEERYYDADRATYGIFDPETRSWSVYDAESEQLLRTVPDNQYTRYERGYTVVLPGDMQSSMSADTGSGAMDMDMGDSDRDDITDVTQ